MAQPVERFSSRVENYVKYRPGYPAAIIALLKAECDLTPRCIVADLGSGTGKLSELFLNNGNRVLGIEPNEAMRDAAERILKAHAGFTSVAGTAEATSLATASVDFVTAGQAFHWFEPAKAKAEAVRILKPGGWAVLIWNERHLDTTPFLRDYEQFLLRFGTDYQDVRHENAVEAIAGFFAPEEVRLQNFANAQMFDFEALRGRVLSSSYTPEPEHPNFEPMLQSLREIFERHQVGGRINFDYETRVYYGHLGYNPAPEKRN